MEKDKMIICVLLIIIIALLVGLFYVMPNLRPDSALTFTSDSTIAEGGLLKVRLADKNGTPIVNQTVNITLVAKNNTSYSYNVKTDSSGTGSIKLDKGAGSYNVSASFDGNSKFKGSKATKKITVQKQAAQSSSSTSTTSNGLKYDINHLPPSNDPYPETKRYQIDQYHVRQEYADDYHSIVDLRTGERHGGYGN